MLHLSLIAYIMFHMSKTNKASTKSLISLALYALMLKHDYDSITVKDICSKAGVSRMSFYRYFSKKDDIFIDFCDERFEEFYSSIIKDKTHKPEEFTLEMFKFIKKYHRQIKILQMAHREFLLLDQLNNYAKYILSNMKTAYLTEQRGNTIFAYFMAGGFFNTLLYWLNTNLKATPEEMNIMLYRMANIKI